VKRPKLTVVDRLFWGWLSEVWSGWRSALVIVKPETVVAWHRKAFRLFWTWKVRRGQPGRPGIPRDVRDLIRKMSRENPLWGAPRIHGELLQLGIEIGETSVEKYMLRHRKPLPQTWRTFLANRLKSLASVDFLTVPAIRFQILYVFLARGRDRRRVLHSMSRLARRRGGRPDNFVTPSLGTPHRTTSCEIARREVRLDCVCLRIERPSRHQQPIRVAGRAAKPGGTAVTALACPMRFNRDRPSSGANPGAGGICENHRLLDRQTPARTNSLGATTAL